jgi:hypothetical protein
MVKEIGFVPKLFERKYHRVITDGGNLTDMKEFCNRSDSIVYHQKRQNYHNRYAHPFKDIKTFDVFYFKSTADATWFKLAFSQYVIQWEWN